MKTYAVNYLKSDKSRAVKTVFVKAENEENAVDKAYDLMRGFYHGDADLVPAKQAKHVPVRTI
jgi:hypothetical protein